MGLFELVQRSLKPCQVGLLPVSRLAQVATIEVDEKNPVIGEQDVVGIEIGMKHASLVKVPDTAADSLPVFCRKYGTGKLLCEGARTGNTHGQQIRAVKQAAAYHAAGYRPWYGQAAPEQFGCQLPFTPGPGTGKPGPQVAVADQPARQSATPVMAQSIFMFTIRNKIGGTAPACRTQPLAALLPGCRHKEIGRYMDRPCGIV